MPRWVLVPALLAGMSAFAGGALVGAHAKAGASPPGPVRSTASAHAVQPPPPAGSCRACGSGLFFLPDPGCTPGAIDPAVTQGDIGRTVCRLWQIGPHPPPIPNLKDELAGRLRRRVCAGAMPLATAPSLIAPNWVPGYRRYG